MAEGAIQVGTQRKSGRISCARNRLNNMVWARGEPILGAVIAVAGAAFIAYAGPYATWVVSLPQPLRWLLSLGRSFDKSREQIRINVIVFGVGCLVIGGGLLVAMAAGLPITWIH